jgi:hypothetical protein
MILRILLLLILPNTLFSQTTGEIMFSFGFGKIKSKMGIVNDYLLDQSYFSSDFYSKPQTNLLNSTNCYSFRIGYKPLKFQDFGFDLSYFYAEIERTPRIQYDNPFFPGQLLDYEGKFHLFTNSSNISFVTKTYFDQIFGFKKTSNPILNKITFASELKLGVGFSKLIEETGFQNLTPSYLQKKNLSSKDFISEFGFIIGYDLNKSTVISSLNLKIGYLFFKTKTLKDRINKEYQVEINGIQKPMRIDYSGLNIGIELTLRK